MISRENERFFFNIFPVDSVYGCITAADAAALYATGVWGHGIAGRRNASDEGPQNRRHLKSIHNRISTTTKNSSLGRFFNYGIRIRLVFHDLWPTRSMEHSYSRVQQTSVIWLTQFSARVCLLIMSAEFAISTYCWGQGEKLKRCARPLTSKQLIAWLWLGHSPQHVAQSPVGRWG